MQFDKTLLAVRERTLPELLDLSLLVVRSHFAAWVGLLAIGAGPMILLNWFLVGTIDLESAEPATFNRYFGAQFLLVMVEAPLATAPLTLYLGQIMFSERVSWRRLWSDFIECLPQLFLHSLAPRALLLAPWFVSLFVPSPVFVLVGCILLIVLAWWLSRNSYITEIVLLERNPLRARPGQPISTSVRTRTLHTGYAGDLLVRGVTGIVAGVLMVFGVWTTIGLAREWIFDAEPNDAIMISLYLPLTYWLALGYLCVLRYLSYLDLRIRSEGWELELRLRTEGDRLSKQLA